MSALTSLLVRDQIVSVRKIEEAIQRQVISGGELDTVFLEMGAVPENVMSAYRAALFGLLPATRDEVMKLSRETLRTVPKEVAAQYQLVPLSAEEQTLVVAVASPLSIEDDQQLGFLLGLDLVYRIVSGVRLAAALSHHYGLDVPPRLRRLAERLRERDAGGVPYVAPPETARVDAKTVDLPSKQSVVDWDDDEDTGVTAVVPEGTPTQKLGTPLPDPNDHTEPADSATLTERPPPPPPTEEPAPAIASAAASNLARKLRGPLSAKAGVDLLKEAQGRDEILEIFFVFARQFFDFTALFVAHDDIAEGRDAHGEGAAADDIRQIAVPLDVPGTFNSVKTSLAPVVTDLRKGELDAIVAGDLGRSDCQPSVIAPVVIRGRVVLMVYGDRGGESFELSDVPELVGFLPRVADAFLGLLLRRKRQGYASPDSASRPGLKSAANRLTAGAIASEPEPEKSGYRLSKEPPAPSADADPLAPSADADPLAPSADADPLAPSADADPLAPSADAEPAQDPQDAQDADDPEDAQHAGGVTTAAADPLGVLGVPRSAPPPPMVEGPQDFRLGKKATRPDGHAAIAQDRSRSPSHGPSLSEMDSPEIVVEYDDDPDGEDNGRPGGEEELPEFAKSQADRPEDGGYQMAGTSEVLGRGAPKRKAKKKRKKRAKKEPEKRSSASRQRSPDPRREGSSGGAVDKVKVPDVEMAEDRRTEPDEHRQHAPRSAPNMPTVIVDMGDTVEVLVDNLEGCGPDDEAAAVNALISLGEAALPTLTQRFPGPLWFDRKRPHRRLPRGRDVSGIARALVEFREIAIPYVISLLDARDADVRFYGTLLASEFVSRDLLVPVGARIFDRDPGTQLLAVDVLRRFSQFPKDLEELLKGVRIEARVDRKDVERRRIAVRALGLLRDVRSVDLLVAILSESDASLAEQAHRALIVLTRQDFGDSQRRWTQWADKNKERHRVEWLIDGLVHSDESIRTAAGDELQVLTQEYYGYHPLLPKHDREVAHKRYRKWWTGEGRGRFTA